MTPLEPTYYFNFFSLVFSSVIVAIVGGNNGIALGRLIQRNRWLTVSSVRLLRLGMWLPFFLLWSYGQILAKPGLPPIFRIFPFSLASGNKRGLFMIFRAAGHDHGSSRYLLSLPNAETRNAVAPQSRFPPSPTARDFPIGVPSLSSLAKFLGEWLAFSIGPSVAESYSTR